MPFEVLDTIARDVRVPQASISYERSVRKTKSGIPRLKALPQLMVSIPTTLAGCCKHERFRFEVGTGTDNGKARITGVPKGVPGKSAPGTTLKHTLVIRFGTVPALGEDAAVKEFCPVRKIDDNTWEVDLPAWFKVEKTAKGLRAVG